MDIKIFNHPQFGEVRTIMNEAGEPMFVGRDVAIILGYANPRKAMIDHIEDEDKTDGVTIRDSIGREQNPILINESGLYSLILSSKLPQAKEFKRWVTSEVLPQVRLTGGYIPVQPKDDEKTILARALEIMKRTVEQKNQLLEEQKPKVLFAEAVTRCENSILIRDLAKLITQNGVKIGQGRLFYWLRSHGYICKQTTRPLQKWVEQGIFVTDLRVYEYEGHELEHCTTRVTGKGQQYFVNGFLTGKFDAENK